MCGRYTLTMELDPLAEYFGFSVPATPLNPRFNICPMQLAPVVVWDALANEGAGGRQLKLMRWGLVPSWAKDEGIASRLINARGETLAEKPSFRNALKHRRCLVLADGFYEWAKLPGGAKQPHYIQLAGGPPFAFAGLWERWKTADGEELETFAIVTCAPNEFMRPIHDRMPVILPRESEDAWLRPATPLEALQALLAPCPSELLTEHAVSTLVNSPKNDAPELIAPA